MEILLRTWLCEAAVKLFGDLGSNTQLFPAMAFSTFCSILLCPWTLVLVIHQLLTMQSLSGSSVSHDSCSLQLRKIHLILLQVSVSLWAEKLLFSLWLPAGSYLATVLSATWSPLCSSGLFLQDHLLSFPLSVPSWFLGTLHSLQFSPNYYFPESRHFALEKLFSSPHLK